MGIAPAVKLRTRYVLRCQNSLGVLLWAREWENEVQNVALNDVLDKIYKGTHYTTPNFYLGLKSFGGGIDLTDTMSSHPGWVESAAYSNPTRPSFLLGAVAGQSLDNSASPAVFSIDADTDVSGLFLCTDATKGGSAGMLYGVTDSITSAPTLVAGQTLTVVGYLSVFAEFGLTPGPWFMPLTAQDDFLSVYFHSIDYTAEFFIGLKSTSGSWDFTDTMSSHPGWTEFTAYDATLRPSLMLGTVSGRHVRSSSPAVFALTSPGDVAGSFICRGGSAKGGSEGVLYWVTDDATSGPSRSAKTVLNVLYDLSVGTLNEEPT